MVPWCALCFLRTPELRRAPDSHLLSFRVHEPCCCMQDPSLRRRFADGAVLVKWGLPDGSDEPVWYSHRLEELAEKLDCVPLEYDTDKTHKVPHLRPSAGVVIAVAFSKRAMYAACCLCGRLVVPLSRLAKSPVEGVATLFCSRLGFGCRPACWFQTVAGAQRCSWLRPGFESSRTRYTHIFAVVAVQAYAFRLRQQVSSPLQI